MVPVESSNLAAVGYDGQGELRVLFHNGALYAYTGVPAHVHEALMAAPSKGQYLYYAIEGRYPYRRLA